MFYIIVADSCFKSKIHSLSVKQYKLCVYFDHFTKHLKILKITWIFERNTKIKNTNITFLLS